MAPQRAGISASIARRALPYWQEGAVVALLAVLMIATGADLWRVWLGDASLGHAPLVPAVSLFLLWQRRERLRDWSAASKPGAAVLASTTLLYAGAYWADIEFLKPLSVIGIALGLCWYLGGWPNVKTCAGALAFLLFTIPWPTTLMARLQLPLQLTSSAYAAMFAGILGIPVHRDGVTLSILPDPARPPTYVILVAQECSGLTSLIVLLAVGYLVAYFTPVHMAKRALLFLLTIPLALFANAARLTFILVAGARHGAAVAQWVHDHEQPILVFLCTVGLMGIRAFMLRGEQQAVQTSANDGANSLAHPQAPTPASATDEMSGDEMASDGMNSFAVRPTATCPSDTNARDAQPGRLGENRSVPRSRWRMAVAIGLLVVALAGSAYARRAEGCDGARSDFLVGLPLPYRDWTSESLPLTDGERSMLQPDAQLLRRYRPPRLGGNARSAGDGEVAEIAVIAGHRKKTVHTPDFCLVGGGWDTLSQRDIELHVAGRTVPATRSLLIRNGERMMATYFFTDGQNSTRSLPQFQVGQIVRRLGGHSSLGAMVRILVTAGENVEQVERRSDDFAQATLPAVFTALTNADK